MDSFELNKIAGAVLGTLLLVMGLGIVAESIFHSEAPETPGYIVEVPEDGSTQTAEAAPEIPIATLLASADIEEGQKVGRKCTACHSFDEGGKSVVGPNLWEVVNRQPGQIEGVAYSSAMMAFADSNSWDYETLNAFLTKPKNLVSGTSMGFAGLKKPEDRAAIIAYLRTLSANPAPLPEVPVEVTATETVQPTE